jgi:hypothetical protein
MLLVFCIISKKRVRKIESRGKQQKTAVVLRGAQNPFSRLQKIE